ncbi:acid protease [Mycena leptocephala]|nr:acid protease [Mycena leptocephala]
MSQNAIHPVSFKTNVVNAQQIQERDCARAKHFKAGHHPHGPCAKKHHSGCPDPSTTISVTNAAVTYTMPVGFGNPATTCDLLIDTGSSNTWVLKPPYKETSTCKDTRKPFAITYGLGDCKGNEYTDQVTLGPNLVIKDQSIGVACEANQMNGLNGIIGIGPVDLTKNTMASDSSDACGIPTVTNNCVKQGLIKNECIGIYYEPTTTANAQTGSLSFGGPDRTKCTGEINYVPITKTSPACEYWGYDQSISYGGKEIMATSACIADTGTTLIMVPTQTFNDYKQATGATCDEATGLLTVTAQQYECMQSMIFTINGIKYELTKNGQIWPRCMNETLGGQKDQIYLVFADMGQMSNPGLCGINGYTFLQRFYSVYDTTNCQIGFATTEHTMATTN